MDPALWAELEGWAQAELRSVNGQIEYLLKQAVAKRRGGGAAPVAAEQETNPVVKIIRPPSPRPGAPGDNSPNE
jgi:hypothetical protein